MIPPSDPIGRADAKAQGLPNYFTGKPCKRGHIDRRATVNGTCLACKREDIAADRMDDPGKFRERDAAWRNSNRDTKRASDARYRIENMDKVNANLTRWRKRNPERNAQIQREYAARHSDVIRAKTARRRSRKRLAAPKWLTPADHAAIAAMYSKAVRLEAESGVQHEVDHIVPLQGDGVCGLHVPWNLRVITRFANRSKGNRHELP